MSADKICFEQKVNMNADKICFELIFGIDLPITTVWKD